MVGILDYSMGNIGSVTNMLNRIGVKNCLITKAEEISGVDKLILPGVGNFGHAMMNLNKSDLVEGIKENLNRSDFFLMGICLGMQLLGDYSEEGDVAGLGLVKGKVVKFRELSNNLKIPHMGWNQVKFEKDDIIPTELSEYSRFYFVHSYKFITESKDSILGSTEYGEIFTSAIRNKNVYGFQFHPEKSHVFGMKLFKQFSEL
jgi:glutamine amidotransferase